MRLPHQVKLVRELGGVILGQFGVDAEARYPIGQVRVLGWIDVAAQSFVAVAQSRPGGDEASCQHRQRDREDEELSPHCVQMGLDAPRSSVSWCATADSTSTTHRLPP